MSSVEKRASVALRKPPDQRSQQDLDIIYAFLHGIPDLSNLHGSALRDLCRIVRQESYDANRVLFYRGSQATCWYILLSGCVFINGSLYLPTNSFGKRTAGYLLRNSDCLTLEPSTMLVIDYPNVPYPHPTRVLSYGSYEMQESSSSFVRQLSDRKLQRNRLISDGNAVDPSQLEIEFRPQVPYPAIEVSHTSKFSNELQPDERFFMGQDCNLPKQRGSRASDTSSLHSGSEGLPPSSIDDQEGMADSDDEEVYNESTGSLIGRDRVRECLEKERNERTEDDIEVLLEFMQHLPAFANMTLSIRRALCAVMVFAVVDKAGTVVMNDGEELDSWSVILNGHVEVVRPNGSIEHLHMGDSFGISVDHVGGCHEGVMKTKVDDCQFVCIEKADYYKILHQGEENIKIHEDHGETVLVTEYRVLDGGNRKGHIVIKGKPENLLQHLVEEHSAIDPTYVEDLLLTYRTFLKTPPTELTDRLLDWFADVKLRDKVTRVILLWVNNHFNDFEGEPAMTEFLEKFEQHVERENMTGQLRLLHIACSAKAKPRTLILVRSSRDEVLPFSVLGGMENKCGIFINKVDKTSRAFHQGLKRGDQILDVNNQSFEYITHHRALELLRGSTHLSLTVKFNPLAFREMILTSEASPKSKGKRTSQAQLQKETKQRLSAPNSDVNGMPPVINSSHKDKSKDKIVSLASNQKPNKLLRAFKAFSILPRNSSEATFGRSADDTASTLSQSSSSTSSSPQLPRRLGGSSSIPDLTKLEVYSDRRDDGPQQIIRVYKPDQTFKHLLVHKETSAHEAVMLALKEFGISDPSKNFSLCEVIVECDGLIKQKRLPDQITGLQDRLALNGRYYLKNNSATETVVPTDAVQELSKECQVSLLQLKSAEVAAQLTLRDFQMFRDIEATEFIDDIFDLESRYGITHLSEFSALVNKEMFWVVSEVCNEPQVVKRAKIIKHFIKIARHCQECKNFNSMFAIVGGLGHRSVSRLSASWDKVPDKYRRLFTDLQDLMDPSRNMSKYRNMLNSEKVTPPLIPFFPVIKKDLTFIHLGNDSKLQGLVNFEKLRMISKEIRHCCNMASAQYDVADVYSNYGSYQDVFTAFGSTTASIFATVRRKRRSSALPSAKRMYEQSQMVKRARAYLRQLKIEEDEQRLQALSYQCEAPPEGLKKFDANTTSTTSLVSNRNGSNDNNSSSAQASSRQQTSNLPKFGTDSADTVNKLMSLSEKSQPYNPKKHPAPPSHPPSVAASQSKPPNSPHHQPVAIPVHLSAESSSVVSVTSARNRGSMASVGSSHSAGATSGVDSENVSLSSFSFDSSNLPPGGADYLSQRSLSSGPSQSSAVLHLQHPTSSLQQQSEQRSSPLNSNTSLPDQVVNTVEDRQPQQRHQHHQISITHISQRPPLPHVPTRALPVSHFHYPSDPSSNNVSLADHADIYQQWPNHQREINVANNLTSIPPVPFTKPLITLHHHRHELQQPQPVLSHHHSVGGSRPPLPAYDEVLRQNPEYRHYVEKTYAMQRPLVDYDPRNMRPIEPVRNRITSNVVSSAPWYHSYDNLNSYHNNADEGVTEDDELVSAV